MNIDERDWTALTVGERVRNLELEGYVVVPGHLGDSLLRRLREAAEHIPLRRSDYTDTQWYAHDLQWRADPAVLEMATSARTLDFLGELFADDVVCLGVSCSRSEPGYPGMALHTDSHPYGSNLHGARGTSPVLVRVLCYLDDLTPGRAPLRVVPYSHLSMHRDAMPYRRYREHPEEVIVTCRAGDAIVISHRMFHGVGPNRTGTARRAFAASYRPAWARPAQPLPEHSKEQIERVGPVARGMFEDPNRGLSDTHIVNWSDDLPVAGPGLGPGRWLRPRNGSPRPRTS
ncbi:phytanoyl-CoA dioxygenase family protein [Actinomadura sp. NPDC047616]|uniref:phytanoyl-CoA dioxygenase family protein n=1 Tax=Actinomadura sp. NPDC047616 TaxID=3155914 RepID=UPI003410EED0